MRSIFMEKILQKIESKKALIGVIGLGYIGLSLVQAFGAAGFSLRGYDKNSGRIEQLLHKDSPFIDLHLEGIFNLLDEGRLKISSSDEIVKEADVLIISVPTSLDRYQIPDLTCLREAFAVVRKYHAKDKLIVLQSSTYPGSTQEELYPMLDEKKLIVGTDYFLAHVPEVVNPGNPTCAFCDIPRIVSGMTQNCLRVVSVLYGSIGCKVAPCSSPKVAESAKLLQNAFRLVNISLINELKIMFDQMGIDIWEVIEAASVKPFGFLPFYPGPGIGGDCIPTDPFYLTWEARMTHGPTTMIDQAGRINEGMPGYVISKIVTALNSQNKSLSGAKILLLGVTYKKDVSQTRYSPSLRIIATLKKMRAHVSYHDPYVEEIADLPQYPNLHMRSIEWEYEILNKYDAVVVTVDHSFYDWSKVIEYSNLLIDTRNISKGVQEHKEKIFKA